MKNTWLWAGIIIIVVTLSISSVFGLYTNDCNGYKDECEESQNNLILSNFLLALGVGIAIVGFVFHS